jgi:hypothetical protein
MSDLLLPPGTRLLHIGPHKTGTTALQIALGKNREAMRTQGVHYVWGGEHLNANLAALAVAKRPTRRFASAKPVPIEHWTSLIEKVNAASANERVVISGEEFCSAQGEVIEKIVSDLGKETLQILITLRPLEKVMASQWQQFVQAGVVTTSIDEWLRSAFDNEVEIESIRRFWVRHRHDQLVHRWVERVGKERVTILVLDESDKSYLYRKVEELVGLSAGTLITDDRLINRSMTLEEAESVRAMYALLKEQGLGELADHVRFMISPSEVIKRKRVPHPSESRITLPSWAIREARDVGRGIVDAIRDEGVRIIGDLNWLAPEQQSTEPSTVSGSGLATNRLHVPVDLAGWTAYGTIISSGIARGDLPPAPTSTLPFSWLRRATGSQLMREVFRRATIRIRQPLQSIMSGRDRKKDE